MRKICFVLLLTAAAAMPSRAQTTQDTTAEALPDAYPAPPPNALSTPPPTNGTLVFHFKYGAAPTQSGGAPSPGARVNALYLTIVSGCITNVEMSHRPADQFGTITASFPASLYLTFPFQGVLVDGPWFSTATYYPPALYPTCPLPAWDVTIPWTVPAPTPPPPPPPANAVVQGFKLDGNGNRFGNATIYVDGNSTGTGNPYGAQVSPNTAHDYSTSLPAGYSVAYSTCVNCINHPDSSWVFGSSVRAYLQPGEYLDLWWKYYAPPNAYLDTTTSYDGNFGGWAYDPSSSATSIAVHVYVDGPAGSGAAGYAITANGSRPDVDNAFGITGNHGFTFTLPSQYLQDGHNHTIYAYAISMFNQPNPLIGKGTYLAPYVEPTCGPGLISCCGDGTFCRTSCSRVSCP